MAVSVQVRVSGVKSTEIACRYRQDGYVLPIYALSALIEKNN
jgi:hypothetical protein